VSDTGELRTQRLVLQPLNMSDLGALRAHWTEPLVRQYLFDGEVLSSAQVSGIIETSQREFAYTGCGMWALRPAARHAAIDSGLLGTALLGTVGLRPLGEDIEIIYSLASTEWGHGYAAEAAEAVLGYAFEILGLERVVAEIDEGNRGSEAVAGRLGMRPFGAPGALQHYAVSRDDWLGPGGPARPSRISGSRR
jgi:[ribosomal protein S5]-alanine N-acetyltransferase